MKIENIIALWQWSNALSKWCKLYNTNAPIFSLYKAHFCLSVDELASSASQSAVLRLLRIGVLHGHVQPNFVLVGHRDVAKTECPGKNVYALLPKLRDQLQNQWPLFCAEVALNPCCVCSNVWMWKCMIGLFLL